MVVISAVLLIPYPTFQLSVIAYQLIAGWSAVFDTWQQAVSHLLLYEFGAALVAYLVLEIALSEFALLVPKPGVPQLRWPQT